MSWHMLWNGFTQKQVKRKANFEESKKFKEKLRASKAAKAATE